MPQRALLSPENFFVRTRHSGWGVLQSVFELKDSAGLVVTVGKYLTPNGTDIDRAGIQPDFRQLPSREAADAALRACRLRPPPALA